MTFITFYWGTLSPSPLQGTSRPLTPICAQLFA